MISLEIHLSVISAFSHTGTEHTHTEAMSLAVCQQHVGQTKHSPERERLYHPQKFNLVLWECFRFCKKDSVIFLCAVQLSLFIFFSYAYRQTHACTDVHTCIDNMLCFPPSCLTSSFTQLSAICGRSDVIIMLPFHLHKRGFTFEFGNENHYTVNTVKDSFLIICYCYISMIFWVFDLHFIDRPDVYVRALQCHRIYFSNNYFSNVIDTPAGIYFQADQRSEEL